MNSTFLLLGFLFLGFLTVFCCVFLILQIRSKKRALALKQKADEDLVRISRDLENLQAHLSEIEAKETNAKEEEKLKASVELTLKKALKRSEEESFHKNTFLSNLSSEIRTPLNNIIGFASLLENEISLLENKELFEYARAISESGDRLINILNNIIDISRIESNEIDVVLQPCSVSTILSSVAQLFVFKANDQKIKFNIINKNVPDAIADDKVLSKVLGGVVDNAIKYTTKGFVNLSSDYQAASNEVTIRIKDSGCGIDPLFLRDIFNAFRQESPGYSKTEQGSRLGLPIAKRLVEMMQGRIEIESEKGTGTTVTIFLKAKEPAVQDVKIAEVPEKEAPPSRKTRTLHDLDIFIVEDDLMNSMVLVEMTKSLGKVTTAVNGEATLKIIEDKHAKGKVFDIMLFDINLPPPYDGIKLMQKIRKQYAEYKRIPFIAQTAYAMTGDREKLLEAGFDDYIAKPINKNELFTIMRNQLEKH
ncbi:MAG: ATP-binding protein [bacterium]